MQINYVYIKTVEKTQGQDGFFPTNRGIRDRGGGQNE